MVIGLTGNIGSGKTTVCQFLADKGCLCLNADVLGRQVSEPGGEAYAELRQGFGAEYFDEICCAPSWLSWFLIMRLSWPV